MFRRHPRPTPSDPLFPYPTLFRSSPSPPAALSSERLILSLGTDCALAALIAARRRAFASGSGRPILAATVFPRESLEKSELGFFSWAPLRSLMSLILFWPAKHPSFGNFEGCPALTAERGSSQPRGLDRRSHRLNS